MNVFGLKFLVASIIASTSAPLFWANADPHMARQKMMSFFIF
jgi:hypothetical protein